MFEASAKRQYIIGAKQVKNAVICGKASRVYIASDSDEHIIKPIVELANEQGTELVYVKTRTELGRMCGINVKAACAAKTYK